jgi:hypothetical protein
LHATPINSDEDASARGEQQVLVVIVPREASKVASDALCYRKLLVLFQPLGSIPNKNCDSIKNNTYIIFFIHWCGHPPLDTA